ncbi:MAG: hypothetical protein ACC628_09480 [Pirellulaceae bacterium]
MTPIVLGLCLFFGASQQNVCRRRMADNPRGSVVTSFRFELPGIGRATGESLTRLRVVLVLLVFGR